MNYLNSYRLALTVSGLLFLLLSILHCFQHLYFPLISGSGGYTQDSVYLFNGSLALLLFFMSLVVLGMAKHKESSLTQLKMLTAILIFSWSIRLILEFVYPVTFPFLMFEQATNIIKAGVVAILCVLLAPVLRERRMRN